MELSKETDFARILELEESYIRGLCDDIIAMKPTLVITEKGISDLAQHFLAKAGIAAIRRVRKTDNLRYVLGRFRINNLYQLVEQILFYNFYIYLVFKMSPKTRVNFETLELLDHAARQFAPEQTKLARVTLARMPASSK